MQLGGRVRHIEVEGKKKKNQTQTVNAPSIGHKMGLYADLFYECANDCGYCGDETARNSTTRLSCCQPTRPPMTPVEPQEKLISFDRFSLGLDSLLAAAESETLASRRGKNE